MFCSDDFFMAQDSGIVISAYRELLDARISSDEYCWGYYLRIENNSDDTISLLGKDISVTDIKGHQMNVSYDGFNGEAPILKPGDFFEFEDYTTSPTNAVLCGSCRILSNQNHQVRKVLIPVMDLVATGDAHRILN